MFNRPGVMIVTLSLVESHGPKMNGRDMERVTVRFPGSIFQALRAIPV